MGERSANAAIKGYFYQFDHTIIQILSASSKDSTVFVEGVEDIDLLDGDSQVFIQCKYYEGSEYNHSLIKNSVIQMIRHFHKCGCATSNKLKYKIYGHYGKGQEKLPSTIDSEFLKKHFLTYSESGITHEVHKELSIDDAQLKKFLRFLEVDINAKSYNSQQLEIENSLTSQIVECKEGDAKDFFYPRAINFIQKLAVEKKEVDRKTTKSKFLNEINKKEAVFSLWLKHKFGDEHYARVIKKKYFSSRQMKTPKAGRIFILDLTSEFDVAKLSALLIKICNRFSHVEHIRTPDADRFCPYLLPLGMTPDNLIDLKNDLFNSGVKFSDGYPFNGSKFSVSHLMLDPSKQNLTKLKFIPSVTDLPVVLSAITGMAIEVFDFYKTTPVPDIKITSSVQHQKIKIDTVYFINEVI